MERYQPSGDCYKLNKKEFKSLAEDQPIVYVPNVEEDHLTLCCKCLNNSFIDEKEELTFQLWSHATAEDLLTWLENDDYECEKFIEDGGVIRCDGCNKGLLWYEDVYNQDFQEAVAIGRNEHYA